MAWAGLRLALTFLTAVPLPGGTNAPPTRRIAAAAMYWAPVVGLLIGGVAAGVLFLAARYGHAGAFLAAVLAIGLGGIAPIMFCDELFQTSFCRLDARFCGLCMQATPFTIKPPLIDH